MIHLLLENIYKRNICPHETIVSSSQQYKLLCEQKSDLYKKMNDILSQEQRELLDEYTNTFYGICEEQAMAVFVSGIKFGIKFCKETK